MGAPVFAVTALYEPAPPTWRDRFRGVLALPWGAARRRAFFELYTEYLASPEWARVRQAVVERDRGECRRCFGAGEVVHHLTYKRIGAEWLEDLMLLCTGCHTGAHRARRRGCR